MSTKKPTTDELMRLLPAFLREIADELERDPQLAKRIIASVMEGDRKTPVGKLVKPSIDFNPFEVLRSGGKSTLCERLEALDIPTLKAIIAEQGLDTSRLAQKWRRKERLVQFIVDRMSARAQKGDVFRNA